MRHLILGLVIISLGFCITQASAVLDTEGAFGKPVIHVYQADTLDTTRLDVGVASTTAVAVIALAGRDYIEIRAGAIAGEEIWVGIATAPTVGAGLCATPHNSVKLNVPSGTVIKTIASGAFPMGVFQGAY